MCGIWAIFGIKTDINVIFNAAYEISHRGPDAFRIESIHGFPNCYLGFHRLAITGALHGMQPLQIPKYPHLLLLYNGEIYNYRKLEKEYEFEFATQTDGEAILHLFNLGGIDFAAKRLDGVFSFCLIDTAERKVFLGRDLFGVKPLYKVHTKSEGLGLSSEVKGLIRLQKDHSNYKIEHFPPGSVETYIINTNGSAILLERSEFYKIGDDAVHQGSIFQDSNIIETNIRTLFEAAVEKRVVAERRIGCLLSGGLDSSLVAAIFCRKAKEMKLPYRIQTFAIGQTNSPDLLAARKMAKFLDTEHHEVTFSPEEGFKAVKDVIYCLESYNPLIIRTSVAQYLLSKYIRQKTDTTIILSGEGSDEIAQGYFFFHHAPNAKTADDASRRLCSNLYMLDVLRTDRTTAAWGLEVRVPFLDHGFSSYYLSLPKHLKQPRQGIEKYTLRSAFRDANLLPEDILWRPKEEFCAGLSSKSALWANTLQQFINQIITDMDLKESETIYGQKAPTTKEALYYRRSFDQLFPNQSHLVPNYWIPKWTSDSDSSSWRLNYYNH